MRIKKYQNKILEILISIIESKTFSKKYIHLNKINRKMNKNKYLKVN